MKSVIATHYARIGRRGGSVSSPAKRAAARLNALKRWRGKTQGGILPLSLLRDGVWYRGQGRTAPVGVWDARARCFWTIAINDFANPATFPDDAHRQVRLKREEYHTATRGTFKPLTAVKA